MVARVRQHLYNSSGSLLGLLADDDDDVDDVDDVDGAALST